MRHVIADVETDNLLDALTVVHCLVIRDLDSERLVSCADQHGYTSIQDGLGILGAAEKVYGHNFIKFDYPALQKVYPRFSLDRARIMDTLLIAGMRWAHIKDQDWTLVQRKKLPSHLAGSHALEAWGYRLGVQKGEYTTWCREHEIKDPWSTWRKEMQTYCEGDTATTKALVQAIRHAGVSAESVEIEQELGWYLAAQERAGVPFDVDKAVALQGKFVQRREELRLALEASFGPLYQRDGSFTPAKDAPQKGFVAGCAMSRVKLVEFNPSSGPHIEFKLKRMFGWVPTEFTEKTGAAVVDEKTLSGLDQNNPLVKDILEYKLIIKRLGQLFEGKQSWLSHARLDGPLGGKLTGVQHIHGRIKQNEAITHRASHSSPNLSAVPKVGKPHGAECRELFYVPPIAGPDGWVLVGADASSLEARCLAHYMARYDGGAYGRLLLEGDVHNANREALGLPGTPPLVYKIARDGAKTWFYAFLYGGGDQKLGSILVFLATADRTRLITPPEGGWTEEKISALGKKRKLGFLKNTPALARLIDDVQAKARAQGYFIMPDGRRTYVRSPHAALNTLLQSAGAIIVKRWIVNCSRIFWAELGEPGWTGQWVPLLWSHDEIQVACRKSRSEWMSTILVEEMRKITDHYHWRVPLDGEAKVGLNWKDTH